MMLAAVLILGCLLAIAVAIIVSQRRQARAPDFSKVAKQHEATILKRAEAEKLEIEEAMRKVEREAIRMTPEELQKRLNE